MPVPKFEELKNLNAPELTRVLTQLKRSQLQAIAKRCGLKVRLDH